VKGVRGAGWFLAVLLIPACGPAQRSGGGTALLQAPDPESSQPGYDLSGGAASGPSSKGGDGGSFTVRSQGTVEVLHDPGPPPSISDPSSSATPVTDLSGDLTVNGTALISGSVTSVGTTGVRSLSVSGGDLVVFGTLQSGGLQGLALSASGTLFVSGTLKTAGAGISLRASRVVITGSALVDGSSGAAGGTISIVASKEVVITGICRFRGGSAQNKGAGGDGGELRIDGSVPVRLFGVVDGRGGVGIESSGGRGGRVSIGTMDPVSSLALEEARGACNGGRGDAVGGRGGTHDLLSSWGGIRLDGTFVAEGGASTQAPGAGGIFKAECDLFGGDLQSGATILVSGGSAVTSAPSGAGGDGGRVDLLCEFDSTRSTSGSGGSITLTSSSVITAGGGDSTGSAPAGKGGVVHLEIPEATISISGVISARGGAASGSGSGGQGGFLWFDSDSNDTATGGALTLEAGSVFDASGGDSASGPGGDARWSPLAGVFNPTQIPIAILLDADSVQGGPNPGGFIKNNGTVIARGGKSNGHGGDVEFHGLGTWDNFGTGELNPVPGDVRNAGDGSGGNGVFTSD